ncbi:MAG: hypothetical protein ABSA75_08430 [Candidatus Bathyarchaeia archaeon]|jgi:hypothetical protein
MSQVFLQKSNGIKCSFKGASDSLLEIPYFADVKEVSPQFEWLKKREYLMTHAEASRAIAHRQLRIAILQSTSTSTMETMKAELVNRLECAVEKLKDVRKEIREAVLAALKMKEDGDDIADCVMATMAALANEN